MNDRTAPMPTSNAREVMARLRAHTSNAHVATQILGAYALLTLSVGTMGALFSPANLLYPMLLGGGITSLCLAVAMWLMFRSMRRDYDTSRAQTEAAELEIARESTRPAVPDRLFTETETWISRALKQAAELSILDESLCGWCVTDDHAGCTGRKWHHGEDAEVACPCAHPAHGHSLHDWNPLGWVRSDAFGSVGVELGDGAMPEVPGSDSPSRH